MLFKKISIVWLLVLCTIYTSESRHINKRCDCSDKTEPDARENPDYNFHYDDARDNSPINQYIIKPKGMDNAADHQRDNPLLYFEPRTPSEENIKFNPSNYPINNIGAQEKSNWNLDPIITEALLKQIWLSHQLGNTPNLKQTYKPAFKTVIRPAIDPLQSHVIPYEDYYKIPLNKIVKNLNRQQIKGIDDNKPGFDFDDGKKIEGEFIGPNYNQNYSDDNFKSEVMPLELLPAKFKYNFPSYYDINNIDKQQINVAPPQVLPLINYGIDNQQENYPLRPQTYGTFDYNIPFKHDSNEIPNKEFIYKNNYDDVLKPINQRKKIPTYQRTATNGNLGFNIPHKYNIISINNEQRHNNIPAAHIAPNRLPSTQPGPGKFSKWILEQIQLLDSKNPGPDKIDLSGLGYSILQILSDNGMYITDNGMLIDIYGTVTNINTLNLTPIIIGNTMSLRHILEGKYGVMPSKLETPYLRAILVTTTHPLKILGIMPVGTTYLPLSTLSSVTNNWSSISKDIKARKSEEEEITNELKQYEPEEFTVDESKKTNLDDVNQKDYYPGQSSNYINVNGNGNNIGRSPLFRIFSSMFPSRRGVRPEEETNDDRPYSKTHKFESQEEVEPDGGRLFIPRIEFQDQPIDILTKRQDFPVRFVTSKSHDAARIHIPSMSSLLDIVFRSEKAPVNNVKSAPNKVAAEISNRPATLSDIVRKFSDPTKALQKLSFMKNDIDMSVVEKNIPNAQLHGEKPKKILKWKKQVLPTIPVDYKDVNVEELLDIVSRSGVDPDQPETPPENVHEGNNAFDVIENEDDDDGDFRIIGGNAATGSGTPLSNKGRSGYVF